MALTNQPSQCILLAFLFMLGLLAAQGSASRPLSTKSLMERNFQEWMIQYGRTYKDEAEKERRFEIFKKNVGLIETHNQKNESYTLGVNAFTDLTSGEFFASHTGYKAPEDIESSFESTPFMYENITSVPDSVNWVSAGAVSSVKNQGKCGSCWSFATAATIEGLYQLTTGQLYNLSEQQMVDCDIGNGEHGCRGGFAESAYKFVISNGGLTTYENYPYFGMQQKCRTGLPAAATIGGYQSVPSNNEQALVQALAHQPVAVVIDARSYQIQHYQGGIYRGPCGTNLNHLVTAVGYGVEKDGTPVWLIKNSWGKSWGQGGYLLLERNINDARGRCGVAIRPSYPTN